MEDRQIIELYWQRSAEAITQSGLKYGDYCFCVANHILDDAQDAEECVNDTWLRAWNAMPPKRPNVLRIFFARITRSISFDRFRRNTAQKRGGGELPLVLEELSECIARESRVENQVIAQELEESIRTFLRTLPGRERDVFLRRYFFTEPVREIARAYSMTPNHVSVLLSRTRAKLKKQLTREGYFDE